MTGDYYDGVGVRIGEEYELALLCALAEKGDGALVADIFYKQRLILRVVRGSSRSRPCTIDVP